MLITPDTSSTTMTMTMAMARMGQMPSAVHIRPHSDESARLCPTPTYLVDGNTLCNRVVALP